MGSTNWSIYGRRKPQLLLEDHEAYELSDWDSWPQDVNDSGQDGSPKIHRLGMHDNLKIVLLVGQSRLHKTIILRHLTGRKISASEILPGDPLEQHTYAAAINTTPYLFVDTPAFTPSSPSSNAAALDKIASCIRRLSPFGTLAGVLFLYDANLAVNPRDRLALRWLQCFAGPAFFRRVVVVAGMWDFYSHNIFWAPKRGLTADRDFARMLDNGGELYLYHYGLKRGAMVEHVGEENVLTQGGGSGDGGYEEWQGRERESLEDMAGRVFGAREGVAVEKMQFVRETMEEGIEWEETQAARVLGSDVDKTRVQLRGGRARVVAACGSASRPSSPLPKEQQKASILPKTSPRRSVAKPMMPTPPETPAQTPVRPVIKIEGSEILQRKRLSTHLLTGDMAREEHEISGQQPRKVGLALKNTSRSSSTETLVEQGREFTPSRLLCEKRPRPGHENTTPTQSQPRYQHQQQHQQQHLNIRPKSILKNHHPRPLTTPLPPLPPSPPPLSPQPQDLPPTSASKPLIPPHDGTLASILRFPFVVALGVVSFEIGLAVSVVRLLFWLLLLYLKPVIWLLRATLRFVLAA